MDSGQGEQHQRPFPKGLAPGRAGGSLQGHGGGSDLRFQRLSPQQLPLRGNGGKKAKFGAPGWTARDGQRGRGVMGTGLG